MDEAIAIDPNFVEAWYQKGCIHEKMTQKCEAIFAFEHAILLDPGNTKTIQKIEQFLKKEESRFSLIRKKPLSMR